MVIVAYFIRGNPLSPHRLLVALSIVSFHAFGLHLHFELLFVNTDWKVNEKRKCTASANTNAYKETLHQNSIESI